MRDEMVDVANEEATRWIAAGAPSNGVEVRVYAKNVSVVDAATSIKLSDVSCDGGEIVVWRGVWSYERSGVSWAAQMYRR